MRNAYATADYRVAGIMPTEVVDLLDQLRRAGWSSGDVAFHDGVGGLVWLVSGRNGANRLVTRRATCAEAWRRAVEQAKAVGMFGREGQGVSRGELGHHSA